GEGRDGGRARESAPAGAGGRTGGGAQGARVRSRSLRPAGGARIPERRRRGTLDRARAGRGRARPGGGAGRRARLRGRAVAPRARRARRQAWSVGRSVLWGAAGGRSGERGGGAGTVRDRRRQRAVGARKRRHHLRELRQAVVGGLHRHDRQAQRTGVCGGGNRAEDADRAPRPGARMDRGTRRPVGRGDAARADRGGGAVTKVRRISTWRESGGGRGRRAAAVVVVLLGCALTGCATYVNGYRPVSLPEEPKQTGTLAPNQREHQRILATYGGAYQDARLEGLITRVGDQLVSASERPGLRYKVTILHSPAGNAFALPTGQLYVTRGLLALASDSSELASVLSHEMAHVIARHAAIREDQARQAALISRVASDVFNDPQMSALTLAKSKLALAGFSRSQELEADGIGVGIASRAGYDPYGAVRFLNAMGRNIAMRPSAPGGIDPRMLDFLSSHPATPDRVKNAQANARQYTAPGTGNRDKANYLAAIDGLPYGEDPSEGFVRGRHFLHPKLGFTFTAPGGFTLDNTAQAVPGGQEGCGQALRLDVVRVSGQQSLGEYLTSGWM